MSAPTFSTDAEALESVLALFKPAALPPLPEAGIGAQAAPAASAKPAPALQAMLTNSKGKYDANIETIARKLREQTEALIGFDDFRNKVMIAPAGTIAWRALTDEDMLRMRATFAEKYDFMPVGKEMMRDAFDLVAADRHFDSGQVWLDDLVWDGVPRVERFLTDYCGAADDEYTRAVSLYIWTGLAGRTLEPGCQLDMVIAMQSRQGTGKSTGLKLLAPSPEQFTDGLSLHQDDDNFKRLIRGKTVVEIAELAGLSRADINVVKRAITRTTEEWIEKYRTTESRYLRRCVLFASTNEREFLPPDETGHRRWLPVEITELDRDRIVEDRDQLWAEGAARFRRSGVAWRDAERLAAGRHAQYEQHDVWESTIAEWLDAPPAAGGPMPSERALRMSEILQGACRLAVDRQDRKAEMRAAKVMRQLGYEDRQSRVNGVKARWWVRQAPPPPAG